MTVETDQSWIVPDFIQEAFPDMEFELKPYSIPSAFYHHRRDLIGKTPEGLVIACHFSKPLLEDCRDNETMQGWIIERINLAMERAKSE